MSSARRTTSEVAHLRVVRDEDVAPPAEGRQLLIRCVAVFLVAAQPKKRRPCAAKRPALILPPTQLPLALDRPRKLSVFGARPRSIGNSPLSRKERAELEGWEKELRRSGAYRRRPRQYAACMAKPGPCPWVSCRHHRYLEVNPDNGVIRLNFPGKAPDEIGEPCTLKIAAEGSTDGGYTGTGHTLEEVGDALNVTQEWVRQIEISAKVKAKAAKRRGDGDE